MTEQGRTEGIRQGVAAPAKGHVPLVAVVMDDEGFRESTQMLLSIQGIRSAPYSAASAFLDDFDRLDCAAAICSLYDSRSILLFHQELRRRSATLPLVVMYEDDHIKAELSPETSQAVTLIETPCSADDLLDTIAKILGDQ